MSDSVSLDDELPHGHFGPGPAIILFLCYLVAVSDFVLHTVVCAVPGTVDGRYATNRGIMVQGVLLVMAYAGIMWLVEAQVL